MFSLCDGIAEFLRKLLGPSRTLHGPCKLACDVGEVARPVGRRRHRNIARADADNLPRALIIAENKKFVAHDGTAQRAAKLVLDELAYRRAIKIAGVQIGIPEEFEYAAV